MKICVLLHWSYFLYSCVEIKGKAQKIGLQAPRFISQNLKDFKGGLLKQNPWPLIFVHFCKKADLSLAYGSWQTETSRPTETLPSLVLTMYWANGFHLWGKQNLGSLKEKSYHSCSINGYISSNDIISTHNLSSRVTCSGCLPWHHLLPSS